MLTYRLIFWPLIVMTINEIFSVCGPMISGLHRLTPTPLHLPWPPSPTPELQPSTVKKMCFDLFMMSRYYIMMFQKCIVMRGFYISYKQVKMTHSLPRAIAVFCGRIIITVNWDYLSAQNQGKLTSVCLQRFSSIFETSVHCVFGFVTTK